MQARDNVVGAASSSDRRGSEAEEEPRITNRERIANFRKLKKCLSRKQLILWFHHINHITHYKGSLKPMAITLRPVRNIDINEYFRKTKTFAHLYIVEQNNDRRGYHYHGIVWRNFRTKPKEDMLSFGFKVTTKELDNLVGWIEYLLKDKPEILYTSISNTFIKYGDFDLRNFKHKIIKV